MTARATAVFDCIRDQLSVQEKHVRLGWTLPAVNAVRAYWHEQASTDRMKRPNAKRNKLGASDKEWVVGSDDDATRFHGPGGFSVWFCPHHAEIHSGCRWSGFLTIKRLRNLHWKAFHRIASVFSGKILIVMPSDSQAQDLLWSGASLEEAVVNLEQEWGSPQRSTNDIESESIRVSGSPRAWFLEDVRTVD